MRTQRLKKLFIFGVSLLLIHASVQARSGRPPMMGWSSWNTFRVNISEDIIKGSADALIEKGLDKVGYRYINIDDGFFGGRDEKGHLLAHPERFPNGMKVVADYIHSKGLRAGIYSDAGSNTCGSIWDDDEFGIGVGLWGHQQQDINTFFKEWGFDFIKVDFCGGDKLNQDPKERYTSIYESIQATGRTDIRYNICRWAFPGTWAIKMADSWRILADITNNFYSVKSIINKNLYLGQYASSGHYNDMDMLEIDRGMSLEEERTHFGIWCIMSSPLMIGCNMRTIRDESLEIIKNEEIIALNQDSLGMQAKVVAYSGAGIVLAKPLQEKWGTIRAIAMYNPSDSETTMKVAFKDLCLEGEVAIRDLWKHKDLGIFKNEYETKVPAHGVVMLKAEGQKWLAPVIYEGEYAFMNMFFEDDYYPEKNTKFVVERRGASGKHVVTGIGGAQDNWAEFRNVYSPEKQDAVLHIFYCSKEKRFLDLSLNSKFLKTVDFKSSGGNDIFTYVDIPICLNKGENCIRFSNSKEIGPDIDKIELIMKKR